MATGGTLSLVAKNVVDTPGGTVLNVPAAASSTNNIRNVRQRVDSSFSNDGGGQGIMGLSIGSLPMNLEMMNKQNRAFMHLSFLDVHSDY
jgi:hypothetical protein